MPVAHRVGLAADGEVYDHSPVVPNGGFASFHLWRRAIRADIMSFAKPALLGPEKVSVGSNARELWGRNEPYSGMPPVRSIWSAPRGSPGMQNSVVPDAQRTLASCGPSASSVRSGGILAGASTCLNKSHRSRQPDIQELPLRTTPRVHLGHNKTGNWNCN